MVKAIDHRDYLQYDLADYIPYLEINDNIMYFKDMSAATISELSFIYDENMSEAELVAAEEHLMTYLNTIEMNTSIQLIFKKDRDFKEIKEKHLNLNKSDKKVVQALFNKKIDKVEQDSNNFSLFNFHLYQVVKRGLNVKIKDPKSLFSASEDLKDKIRAAVGELIKTENRLNLSLRKAGIYSQKPDHNEVCELIGSTLNLEPVKCITYQSNQDFILSDLEINKDYLYVNGKYARVVTFKKEKEPEEVYITIINELINSNLLFDYDLVLNIRKIDKEKEIARYKNSRILARSQMFDFITNFINTENQIKEQKITDVIVELENNNTEEVFELEFFVVVKADTLEKLNNQVDLVMTNISQMKGARGYKESFGNFSIFLSSLPGNMTFNNYRNLKFRTSYLVDLLPVFGPLKGTGVPLMLFRNRDNGITYIDPLSEKYPSKNGIIAGATGQGKSFVMNLIMANYLGYDPLITIVEKGSSYKKFVLSNGGDYFDVNFDDLGNSRYKINPFNLQVEEKDMVWRTIIESMVRDENSGISNDDKIVIEDSIEYIIGQGLEAPVIDDFLDSISSLDYQEVVMKEAQAKIKRHLKRWTKGRLSDVFNNRSSNLDVSNEIIGFNLDGFDKFPDIMEIFMFYLSTVCDHKAAINIERKKVFTFDEVWKLFLSKEGGELIEKLFRTVRKYHGSVFAISQAVDDFLNNPYSKGIMSNIAFFYLLKQGKCDFDLIKERLDLTDQQVQEIKKLESVKGFYSDMFIKTPDMEFFARLIPCPFEYWLATTDGNDYKPYQDALKHFDGNVHQAINFLAEKYPHGALH